MEEAEPGAIEREDGTWLVDGMMPISDFISRFDLPEQPADEIGDYHTLAGFVVTRIGHVPSPSEKFTWGGYRFEVIDMDLNRVDKVLLIPPRDEKEEQQSNSSQDDLGEPLDKS
jgi:putative hemolysin